MEDAGVVDEVALAAGLVLGLGTQAHQVVNIVQAVDGAPALRCLAVANIG